MQNLSKRAQSHLNQQTGTGVRVYKKRKLNSKNHSVRERRLKDIFDKL